VLQSDFTRRWTFAGPGPKRYVIAGDDRPAERREQRLGVGVGDGKNGDLRDRLRVGEGEPLRALRRTDAGCERVARIERHVGDAAALHAGGWTHRAGGEDAASREAVVPRIGVDQAADGAMLGGDLRLDAAPRLPVTRDDDGAFDSDAVTLESLVVGGCAIVHVDERSRHVAVGGVGVVGRQLLVLLIGRRVAGHHRFLELGDEARRRGHLHDPLLRSREEHVELLDVRVETVGLELRENPVGVLLVVRRAHVVGTRREEAHVLAHAIGGRHGDEPGLPLALEPRRGG
jgi:hypothetical protein